MSDLGDLEIVTMNANGDNKTNLTNNRARDAGPAFSANGKKIAFTSGPLPRADIFTMSATGTDKKRVTTGESREADPAWSPDGTRIAFRGGNKIYVMKAARVSETNIPKRLTTSCSDVKESEPAWSPNGTRIAFIGDSTLANIYAIRADGSDLIQLTNSILVRELAWSPDGTKIAFRRGTKIFVMKAARVSETNRPKQLTSTGSPSFEPDWQPLR
jgi:TolB protein